MRDLRHPEREPELVGAILRRMHGVLELLARAPVADAANATDATDAEARQEGEEREPHVEPTPLLHPMLRAA
jgi:hypothetical protein